MKSYRFLRAALIAAVASTGMVTHPAEAQMAVKVGVSHANVSNSGTLPGDLGARTGFTAGLSFNTEPSLVGLGVEALYTQRGTNGADGFQLDYIDVPAYLKVMLPMPGLAPYAYAGPQVSFEVRCGGGSDVCLGTTDRAKTTYSAVIGAGVLLGKRLSLEGRYIYGLKDLHLATVSSGDSYKSRSFEILAGINF